MTVTRSLTQPLTRPLAAAVTQGVGGGSFSPAAVAGLAGWYDPSSIATLDQSSAGGTPVTASLDPVGRMLDRSGSGNTTSMATAANRPLYTAASGLSWLELDGLNDGLVSASGGGASTGFLVCIAFRADTLPGTMLLFDNRSGNTGFQVYVNHTFGRIDAPLWNGATAIANPSTNGSIVAGADYIVTVWYDGTNARVQVNSTAAATSAVLTLAAGAVGLGLGRTIAGANYLDGRIYGAIYVKDENPSSEQREAIKSYLAAKAGVTL